MFHVGKIWGEIENHTSGSFGMGPGSAVGSAGVLSCIYVRRKIGGDTRCGRLTASAEMERLEAVLPHDLSTRYGHVRVTVHCRPTMDG